jgi:HD-GYP domain-containing protein (c-di-GMP phosphodiesterase class II)
MHAGTPQGTRSKALDHQYPQSANLTEQAQELDDQISQSDFKASVEPSAEGMVDRLGPQRVDRYDHEQMELAVRQREQQVSYVEGLFVSMVEGASAETEALADVCSNALRSIVADKDMFLCLGLNPFDADYPSRHSLHVCTIALSMGVTLGLDDASLADLGTGCLIHDVGMMKLDRGLYKAKRRLTQKELLLLADHPVHTLEALACPGVRISRIARIVAYQIHERCNGSGYPRGRLADEIHPLARVAAVADAYVGLVSNRSHRPGLMPYHAITKLLESIPEGVFDPKAVRALLHTTSLFPIGSFVRLENDRIARVVRSTGESYMTPMIELWNEQHRQFESDVINLGEEPSIKIAGPLASPTMA